MRKVKVLEKKAIGWDALRVSLFKDPEGSIHYRLPKGAGELYWEWVSNSGLSGSGFAVLEDGWETTEAYRSDQLDTPEIIDKFKNYEPVPIFYGHGAGPDIIIVAKRLPNGWEPSWRNISKQPERRALWLEGRFDGYYASMRSPWWCAWDYGCAHVSVIYWKPSEDIDAQQALKRLMESACWLSLRAMSQETAHERFCTVPYGSQGTLLRNGIEVSPYRVLERLENEDLAYPFIKYKGKIWQTNPYDKDSLIPLTQVGKLPTHIENAFETEGDIM